jgi:hypothetical protein
MNGNHMDWHTCWTGLAALIAAIFVWFAFSYKGRHSV